MKIYGFADEASSQLDGQIQALLRNGLDGLEVRGVNGANISDISLEDAAKAREQLVKAGLSVWSVGSPIGKINIVGDDYQAHLEKFRHTLEVAKVLGAENIRIFSFYMPKNESYSQYREEVIFRLKELVSIAEDTGIALCHENEKGIYGDNAQRCLELYQAVPELKGVFDPANFVQCGQDTLEAWEMLRPYTKYLHIKDVRHDGKIVPAGEGDGNIPVILKEYLKQGGTAVTVEPHLAVFDGLAGLEQSGNTSEVGSYTYASSDAAFDAACEALKKIL